MFIDIHAHAYRKAPIGGNLRWICIKELIDFYDSVGVEKAAVMPIIGPECNRPQANEDILEMAENYPDRVIPFCNVHPQCISNDPHYPLEDIFMAYKDAGCKGVGEVMCNKSFFDPYMRNFFRAIEKTGLPMTFHLAHRIGGCYGIYDEAGLPGLDETLRDFPNLRMLGHSQTFWAEISVLDCVGDRAGWPTGKVTEGAVPKLLRKHRNLFGDLSAGSGSNALMRDPEFAVGFLNEFQDQLCFGLDVCLTNPQPEKARLATFLRKLRDDGKISEDVFDKIAKMNAIRLLGL